jgi:hypothetical protein
VLSIPAREFPDFPAALSLCAPLGPDDVRAQLETRVAALEVRLAELERPVPGLLRVFLLESEYAAAVVRAELKWLRAVVADLRSRKLSWSEEEFRRFKAAWETRTRGEEAPVEEAPVRKVRQGKSEPRVRRTKLALSSLQKGSRRLGDRPKRTKHST